MYHITGFDRNEVIDLCVLINSAERGPDSLKWPPILGLFKSVTVTLALAEPAVRLTRDPENSISDKGSVGNDMRTPINKPAGGELSDWQKEFNIQGNKIRWVIEQVISHFKTWRTMHTDYRRPIDTFATTISAVIGLHFYRMA